MQRALHQSSTGSMNTAQKQTPGAQDGVGSVDMSVFVTGRNLHREAAAASPVVITSG